MIDVKIPSSYDVVFCPYIFNLRINGCMRGIFEKKANNNLF